MSGYAIRTKKTIKPMLNMILVYLADDDYQENTLEGEKHRSDSLCWIGRTDELKSEIVQAKDLDRLIDKQIKDFNAERCHTIVALYELYHHDLVAAMRDKVYAFIKETYLRIAD